MNPAAHSAREDAERSGTVVGSDVDRVEAALIAEGCGCPRGCCEGHPSPTVIDDETTHGSWLWGERDV